MFIQIAWWISHFIIGNSYIINELELNARIFAFLSQIWCVFFSCEFSACSLQTQADFRIFRESFRNGALNIALYAVPDSLVE